MLAAVPAAAEEDPRLLVLDVKASRRDRGAAKAITARFTHGLAERLRAVTVYSTGDLARLADLEVEKQRLGCDTEQASCLSELADAFGARFVSYGNIGSVGAGRYLELTVVDVNGARPVERIFLNADDVGGLLEALEGELEKAARSVQRYLGVEPAKQERKKPKKRRKKLSRREAEAKESHRLQALRAQHKLRDLETRYAVQIGGATTTFVVGGLMTGACASVCGIGAVLDAGTSDLRTTTGSDLMVCGGVGAGISLLATLGAGVWQLSAASETEKELALAKEKARRAGSYRY
jgi:hypothetical protein